MARFKALHGRNAPGAGALAAGMGLALAGALSAPSASAGEAATAIRDAKPAARVVVYWPRRLREAADALPGPAESASLSITESGGAISVESGDAPGAITLADTGMASGISLGGMAGGGMARGAVSFSRAADALGAPVDLSHPSLAARPVASGGLRPLGSAPTGLPLGRAYLSSGFGLRGHPILGGVRMHSGIDLAAPTGSPVFAPGAGVVSAASWNGGYGLFVAIDHGNGTQTRYGHLSRIAVVPGQQLRGGEVIGHVGSTGRSTGAHLHYEVRIGGRAINPLQRR